MVRREEFSVQAARETGALKEAKDKLEKRVEELTWRLEFEKHLRVWLSYIFYMDDAWNLRST